MSKNDFYTPTDIDALRMENELLAFEVRFLKARLADPPENSVARQLQTSKRRLDKAEQDRERLQAQVNELQVLRANLHAQKADLQGQLANLQGQLANLQAQSQSLVNRLFRRSKEN